MGSVASDEGFRGFIFFTFLICFSVFNRNLIPIFIPLLTKCKLVQYSFFLRQKHLKHQSIKLLALISYFCLSCQPSTPMVFVRDAAYIALGEN